MRKIAVIGAGGFVGRNIVSKLSHRSDLEVISVSRDNYDVCKRDKYDCIVHSAMPSKRWWALNNPLDDFNATVGVTADIVYEWRCERIALISSVSARVQLDHPYGIHKRLSEKLVIGRNTKNVVFRLGGLFGKGLDKGVIYDMFEGNKIFLTEDSAFNYIDTAVASEIIVRKLELSGVIDIGARDSVTVGEIAGRYGLDVKFGDRKEMQNTLNPDSHYPLASEVFAYIDHEIVGDFL